MDVADAGTNQECQVDAVPGNLVTDDVEVERLLGTFPQNGDANVRTLGAFEQVGNIRCAHVVSGLTVDGGDHVTGPDSGAIGGAAHKGRNHDDFVVAWSNRHAYAVVLAALLFPQQGVGL